MGALTDAAVLVAGVHELTGAMIDALRAEGARVALVIEPDEAAAAKAIADDVVVIEAPIGSIAHATPVISRAIDALGGLTALLTPVPPQQSDGLLALTQAEWQAFSTRYLTRSVALAHAATEQMVEHGGGRIVTFASSTTFLSPGVEQAAVNAAILSLTSAITLSVPDRGINANCVVLGTPGAPQGGLEPIGAIDPAVLAATVVHLCSEGASNLHGRFVYCGGSSIGLYTMPLIIENANVVVDFAQAPTAQTVADFLAPLTNVGKE